MNFFLSTIHLKVKKAIEVKRHFKFSISNITFLHFLPSLVYLYYEVFLQGLCVCQILVKHL